MARRCRNSKGRFTRCSTKGAKRKTTKRKSTGAARKGRCVKWSKGRKRCLKRAK